MIKNCNNKVNNNDLNQLINPHPNNCKSSLNDILSITCRKFYAKNKQKNNLNCVCFTL